ncbi:MAG TPA: bifunctional hydroxymethylpyrimidine kinase/phosphomethylpyrimidine kinase [Steroidobacteraceae bacterium]|nr:bifunctional hydroxymethylpyrimidine kinase/phosphomethylpyrimidine kinase [Steroidobacteraceae bacterium]
MIAVLVIAGSDSSGGAGLTRDVQTLAHLGVGALCALTAVTAQTDTRVVSVYPLPADIVRAQIAAALATRRVGAVKIGMLATGAAVTAVADSLPPRRAVPLVLDPVLAASSGGALLEAAGHAALREVLLPRVTLLTPNIPEAAALLGEPVARGEGELLRQGCALLALGPEAVLLKGGHGDGALATDLLLTARAAPQRLTAPRSTAVRRGTGCTLSTAIAAGLARGLELTVACEHAKQYVTNFIQHGS